MTIRSLAFALLVLTACTASAEVPQSRESGTSGGDVAPVCEVGADQSCNDDPAISSLHGRCLADGTCECAAGIEKNPDTGRCL